MKHKGVKNLLTHDQDFFHNGCLWVVGADEAGRGPLAGPVSAGAVAIDVYFLEKHLAQSDIANLFQDSKTLSEKQRQQAWLALQEAAQSPHLKCAYAEATVEEIETKNILGATTQAFQRALEQLQAQISHPFLMDKLQHPLQSCVLVDGYALKALPYQHQGVIKGDQLYFCIAAASIVAKVLRDQTMEQWAQRYPEYHFEQHKGYGTAAHIEVLKRLGPCPIHRKTFIKNILNTTQPLLTGFMEE